MTDRDGFEAISLRLPAELLARIDRLAVVMPSIGQSPTRSAAMRQALVEGLALLESRHAASLVAKPRKR